MTPDQLTAIGTALYGTQWQSDLARALNVDSRRVRQWLKEERPIPDWLDDELKVLLNEKISLCQSLL
ncbi:helix-turn-helix domain-containing protein [Moraxella bovis]|uniref:Helix-turn-helix domain-containing protein n=1 Tax=Moraxella bovis TaxID=476 RepID=A0AAX3ER40_MORBO|nr:helix-turn-helix domain-containing protein [Moraxella bovis]UYZ74519.1 helix-turn-helix domain-containing protein [Moraxella bovis]UYZ79555.1 helix-turn-helix domain-containing protein [Moraxella bovis]UYZ79846.1 helix-turn-helix domain-containing protein [Moraxella bovis]UYZ88037.1 helix-turn-helix domain-containing protein [Moraxella bovis]UYZ90764.1 helix-turn-helix domain-containing protein [Moraxella bovis]